MKWTNKGHVFDLVAQEILNVSDQYYIWGTAVAGSEFYHKFKNELNITHFLDSDNTKMMFCDLLVLHKEDLSKVKGKIIIASRFYEEIKKILIIQGFIENIDFFFWKTFDQVYFLYKYNQLVLYRVDISITNRCTLQCKYCNMFMPHFKNPQDNPLQEIKDSIDFLFNKVDFVNTIKLLGGEPFLNKELDDIILYIYERYEDKIGYIEIFTNGTILPNDKQLTLFQKHKIKIQITDYTSAVDYKIKLQKFIDKLNEYNIKCSYYSLTSWLDFGFPHNNDNITGEEKLINKFDMCQPDFRGLVGDRLYFCHLSASAEKAGLFKASSSDFIVLDESNSKFEILEFDLGYSQSGYVSFCTVCRGCDGVNSLYVDGKVQMRGLSND